MNKTKIEWCDYTVNPVKGLCPMACDYCYARRMYKRFKWNPELKFNSRWYASLLGLTEAKRIFVGSTIELFGDWIPDEWQESIIKEAGLFDGLEYPKHTFIFLTKQPQNLIKWSPFPDNCWIGISATDATMFYDGMAELNKVKASVKFVSFEPLLEPINGGECEGKRLDLLEFVGINWVIIGQQTPPSKKTEPKMSWIQDILVACSNAGNMPVFMKNNLKPLFVGEWAGWKLRQEFPEVK